jgi:hypothetical protein
MAKIESLNILLDTTGKDYLAELSGVVIENIQKATLSYKHKNQDLSGDPVSGTVECRRFVNANSTAYGAARAAGKGASVKAKPVTVAINEDKEIVEELEAKDVRLYSVDDVLTRRSNNHVLSVATALDRAFYAEAYTNATKVNVNGVTDIADILEKIIQECENLKNDFVDGVPRDMMALVLSTKYYGMVRNDLDKKQRANVDTTAEEFYAWHGVECDSCTRLPAGCDILLMVKGAVAQPVMMDQYAAEKVPLSDAIAVELFYHYGTKAVTPDLIFAADFTTPSTETTNGE